MKSCLNKQGGESWQMKITMSKDEYDALMQKHNTELRCMQDDYNRMKDDKHKHENNNILLMQKHETACKIAQELQGQIKQMDKTAQEGAAKIASLTKTVESMDKMLVSCQTRLEELSVQYNLVLIRCCNLHGPLVREEMSGEAKNLFNTFMLFIQSCKTATKDGLPR